MIRWNHSPVYIVDKKHSRWLGGNGYLTASWYGTRQSGLLSVRNPSFVGTDLWVIPTIPAQGLVQVGGRWYRGAVELRADADGILSINKLGIEDYLRGILPGEMSASWEGEALKAQAIAARSYGLFRVRNPRSPFWDLESGTQDQSYLGQSGEKPATDAAVKGTEGIYLGDLNSPIEAYFHSRCGGTTETSKVVWNTETPAGAFRIPCVFCRKKPYTWKSRISRASLIHALHLSAPETSPIAIRALGKSPTGRITQLRIASADDVKVLTTDQFRALVGYEQIKSAVFKWTEHDDTVDFEGVGFGHGVGMCQWGARRLAQQGKTFRQILSYYYPGIALRR